MADPTRPLTLDDVRDRLRVAGLRMDEARLEMVRALLDTALAPVRAMDPRAAASHEPAVTFDAANPQGRTAGGR